MRKRIQYSGPKVHPDHKRKKKVVNIPMGLTHLTDPVHQPFPGPLASAGAQVASPAPDHCARVLSHWQPKERIEVATCHLPSHNQPDQPDNYTRHDTVPSFVAGYPSPDLEYPCSAVDSVVYALRPADAGFPVGAAGSCTGLA